MTSSPTESLVARLKASEGIGAALSGDSRYVTAIMAEAAERLSTLEAALRPFAECIDRLAPGDDIAHWRLTDALDHGLTVEHVIRARTALSNEAGK